MSSSAKKHWKAMRYSSMLLAPLALYFILNVRNMMPDKQILRDEPAEYGAELMMQHALPSIVNWMSQPLNSILAALFVICAFYHASIGMDEVIEDYVHTSNTKTTLRVWNRLFFLGLGATCLYVIGNFLYFSLGLFE